jgi:hypothetical protein
LNLLPKSAAVLLEVREDVKDEKKDEVEDEVGFVANNACKKS